MSLLGLQKLNIIKGNISVLFKGRGSDKETLGELLVIDHKQSTVKNIFNISNETKINQEISDIMSGKQILKKIQTQTVSTD